MSAWPPVHLPPAPDAVPPVATPIPAPTATPAVPPTATPDNSATAAAATPVNAPAALPITQETPATPAEEGAFANTSGKRLIFTASKDSFIRVTALDGTSAQHVVYSSVLRTGQSIGFDGRKFSVNVSNPSAVAITLDGVNYGPHSDQESPDTFTLESHQP